MLSQYACAVSPNEHEFKNVFVKYGLRFHAICTIVSSIYTINNNILAVSDYWQPENEDDTIIASQNNIQQLHEIKSSINFKSIWHDRT